MIHKYQLPILHKPSGLNKAQPTFDAQMLGSILTPGAAYLYSITGERSDSAGVLDFMLGLNPAIEKQRVYNPPFLQN